MEKVDTVVVDKTGTLTEGKPRLVIVLPVGEFTESELLQYAAGLESGSEHPLAAAILAGARERGLSHFTVEAFESLPGKGVRGKLNGRSVALGNLALMKATGIDDLDSLSARADALRQEGQTVVYVAVDRRVGGLLGVADPIKNTTAEAVNQLHSLGIRVVMLTGDSRATAEAVGRKLGIDEVIAEVLPEQKAATVQQLKAAGRVVAMASSRNGG
jgi:Cu+-exporting ATPase